MLPGKTITLRTGGHIERVFINSFYAIFKRVQMVQRKNSYSFDRRSYEKVYINSGFLKEIIYIFLIEGHTEKLVILVTLYLQSVMSTEYSSMQQSTK